MDDLDAAPSIAELRLAQVLVHTGHCDPDALADALIAPSGFAGALRAIVDAPTLARAEIQQGYLQQVDAEWFALRLLVDDGLATRAQLCAFLDNQPRRSSWLAPVLVRTGIIAASAAAWFFERRRQALAAWRTHARRSFATLRRSLDASRGRGAAITRWLRADAPLLAALDEAPAAALDRLLDERAICGSLDDAREELPSANELRHEGVVFGYRLQAILARGNCVVYKARHIFGDRDVALKVMPLAASSTSSRAMAIREAIALARVEDPSVVDVHDFGGCKDAYYIATELVAGESLAARCVRARLSERAALEVGRQVLVALGALDRQGLVHRDIKAGNVILGGDHAILIDLGTAHVRGVADPNERWIGTPAYAAPEEVTASAQARAAGSHIDARADLYALGVMLVWAITGAFSGPTDRAGHEHWIAGGGTVDPRALAPWLSAGTAAFLGRLTRTRPDERFASVADACAALDALRARSAAVLEVDDVDQRCRCEQHGA